MTTQAEHSAALRYELAPYQGFPPADPQRRLAPLDDPTLSQRAALSESVPEAGGFLIPPRYSARRGRR